MQNVNLEFALKVYATTTKQIADVLRTFKSKGYTMDQTIEYLDQQTKVVPTWAGNTTGTVSVPFTEKVGFFRTGTKTVSTSVTKTNGGRDTVAKRVGFLYPTDIAKHLGIVPSSVYSWIRNGSIKPVKIDGVICFKPNDVNDYLSRRGLPLIHPDAVTR